MDSLTINEDTIIIAHSIAPIFVCKYLVTNNIRVRKLIFVCRFNNYLGIDDDFDSMNKPMFIDKFYEVKNLCSEIVRYYFDNDPYVKFEVEKDFADNLTQKQYIIEGADHINAESGYIEFKEILKEI